MIDDVFCHIDSGSAVLERLRQCVCWAVSVCRPCALCVAHMRSTSTNISSAFRVCSTVPPICYIKQTAVEKMGGLSWGGEGVLMKKKKSTADEMWNKEHRHLLLFPSTKHPSLMTLLLLSRGDRIGLVTSSVLASECWAQTEREREALNRLFVGNQIMKTDRKTASTPCRDGRNPV